MKTKVVRNKTIRFEGPGISKSRDLKIQRFEDQGIWKPRDYKIQGFNIKGLKTRDLNPTARFDIQGFDIQEFEYIGILKIQEF